MAVIRDERKAVCCCDKCGKLSWPVPPDWVEKLLESLVRKGWRFLDADGQPETLCDICMRAEPIDA